MNVIHYIIFILFFLIIYSVCFKTVEGFDDDFYYYNKLIDYKTIPPSFVNDATPSRTVNKFGFYKGKGTFKKGYTKDIKTDEKISTLNKLLNRLLGRIVSDNQDCVGSFGKYSECDKSCGSNSFQTRKYNITQERGKNGKDCPFVDGYEEKIICDLDECQIGDICKSNEDCETGNCNPNSTRCENMVPCDSENVHVCNETQCMQLNEEYDNNVMQEGFYMYNNVDEECFFKTPAEIEELNLNVFTYDYRTISDQVKDAVLECEYYQVKKDDVGPCINGSNIMIENDEPICKPGYGPEPTIFNGLNACQNCIIDSEDRIAGEKCLCKNGGIYNKDSEICEGETTRDTSDNLCEENSDDPMWFVKKQPAGVDRPCELCPSEYQFRKKDSVVSCVACPAGSNTFSSTYCNPGPQEDLLSVCTETNFKQNYLVPEDEWSDSLENDDYYEKCISGLTERATDCGTNQTRIGNDCKCTGDHMDFGAPQGDDGVCSQQNCLEGSTFNNDDLSCEPENCGDAKHCQDGAEDDDCYQGHKKCLSCKQGYELNANTGVCDSCSSGYHMTGSYETADLICGDCSEALNCQREDLDNDCVSYGDVQVKRCADCNRGYELNADTGVCDSCSTGYLQSGTYGNPDNNLTCTECEPQVGCGTPGEDCVSGGQAILTCTESGCNEDYYFDAGICNSDMMIPKPECTGFYGGEIDRSCRGGTGICMKSNGTTCDSSYSKDGRQVNCAWELSPESSTDRTPHCERARASRDYQPDSFENECCQRPVGYPTSQIQIREDKGAIWNTIKDCSEHYTNDYCDNCIGHTGEVCMAKDVGGAYKCGECGVGSCLIRVQSDGRDRIRDCICAYNETC